MAKILDKKVDYAAVTGESNTGQKVLSRDRLKRDMSGELYHNIISVAPADEEK